MNLQNSLQIHQAFLLSYALTPYFGGMKWFRLILLVSIINHSLAQSFTKADSLRGTYGASRNWWDVTFYNLQVTLNPTRKLISGKNTIYFKTLTQGNTFQIDLQIALKVDSIIFHQKNMAVKNEFNAWFISLPFNELNQQNDSVTIYYSGSPRTAKMPPWDGGLIWRKDQQQRDWISVACQSLGASVWWPNKDHLSDEPDNGMAICINAPDSLTVISNGKLVGCDTEKNKTKSWHYKVVNPINNYDVTFYAGHYTIVRDTFDGIKGKLPIEYVFLDYNKSKIETDIKPDTKKMLSCFEYWFGPYPFYEDGYKLVESSYLGMEHQSAIAYGNKFKKGYLGRDRSGTGAGKLWDFIIVHESGHEWFGNNITNKDIADMWIHEGFTTYSEVLFMQCTHGKDTADMYARGLRINIANDKPVIGAYNVNTEGSDDMYDKGANMIHTIRQIINNDTVFHNILLGINSTFAKKTVTTKEVEDFISEKSGINFNTVFNQYLRTKEVPKLDFKIKNKQLTYQWVNCIAGFDMPVKVKIDNETIWLHPKTTALTYKSREKIKSFEIDPNFYIRK